MRFLLLLTSLSLFTSISSARSTDEKTENSIKTICNVFAENFARGEYQSRYQSTGEGLHITSSETIKSEDNQYSTLVKTQVWRDYLLVDGPTYGYNCFICSQSNKIIRISKEGSIEKACK